MLECLVLSVSLAQMNQTDYNKSYNRLRGWRVMTDTIYECFLAAAETLNFTLAAKKIHITQPAFSRNIAALEQEFGFSLFWRNKQSGLRITPAGLVVYKGLKSLAEDYHHMILHARRVNRGEEGKLIISILNGYRMGSQTFKLIRKFQEKYPQIEIILKSCNFAQMSRSIEDGQSDISILLLDCVKNKANILYEPVYSIVSYLVVPASLGCDPDKRYYLKDFSDQTFLLSEDAPEINAEFFRTCAEEGFEPKTKMAPDYETKMMWAEIGQGLAGNCIDHYMTKSPYVNFIRIQSLHDMYYAVAWNKDNLNPSIALFYSTLDEVLTS